MPGEDDGYVRSATGGAIPGPKVPRNGSSRSDIPNFGVLGDEIDPRHIYSSKRSPSTQGGKVQTIGKAAQMTIILYFRTSCQEEDQLLSPPPGFHHLAIYHLVSHQ